MEKKIQNFETLISNLVFYTLPKYLREYLCMQMRHPLLGICQKKYSTETRRNTYKQTPPPPPKKNQEDMDSRK